MSGLSGLRAFRNQIGRVARAGIATAAVAGLIGAYAPSAGADEVTYSEQTGDTIIQNAVGNKGDGYVSHPCGVERAYDGHLLVEWKNGPHFSSGETITLSAQSQIPDYAISGSAAVPSGWSRGMSFLIPIHLTLTATFNGGGNPVAVLTGQTSGLGTLKATIHATCDGSSGTGGTGGGGGPGGPGTEPGPPADTTPPTITLESRTPAPNASGWNNTDVTVTWSCSDDSGVVSPTVSQTVSTEGAGQSATGTCEDTAGNTSSDTVLGINIDKTDPATTFAGASPSPNANGWNNTDVTLTWNCSDDLSGVVSATDSETLSSEGEHQSATGTCDDKAGNSSSSTDGDVNIDKTKPVPTITTPAASGEYILGQPVASNYGCTDNLSGVATCVGPVANGSDIDTASVGSKSFTVNSTDNADNSDSATNAYAVVYGACADGKGLRVLQPVNDTAHGAAPSIFKLGSTVPVKFRACDWAGNSIGTPGVVQSFKLIGKSAGAVGTDEATPPSTTPDTEFRWSADGQQWIFNLGTKSYSKSTTYTFRITLNSGQTIDFSLGFK